MKRSLPAALLLLIAAGSVAAVPTKRPTDLDRGKELYQRHCWQCHGLTNKGDGPATAALVAEVPNLVGKVKSNEEAVRKLLRGTGSMPGFEASFDRVDARRALQYMATVTDKKPVPDPRKPPAKPSPKPKPKPKPKPPADAE